MQLSSDQKRVLKLINEGKNVFFTGAAGTGKSLLLKHIVSDLRQRYEHPDDTESDSVVFITSTTGVSAFNINGITLHSYAGIGLGKESKQKLLRKIMRKQESMKRWLNTQVLIIDEISMLTKELFEKLDYIARKIRQQDNKPFGGIQLIFCGDFFQLPPIIIPSFGEQVDELNRFCFQSDLWKECIDYQIELTTNFRQGNDKQLALILNEIRKGNLSDEHFKTLTDTSMKEFNMNDGVEPTRLYTINKSVDAQNNMRLRESAKTNKLQRFKAKDWYVNYKTYQYVLKNCMIPETIDLCVGAQVMLIANLSVENGLTNGSRGVVVAFHSDTPNEQALPIVKFTSFERPIKVGVYEREVRKKNFLVARRIGIPLKLAWAVTIHKSQGLTIDKLIVDLNNSFEYGQVYVALSRAKNLKGLSVRNLEIKNIKTHPEVIKFYNQFMNIDN